MPINAINDTGVKYLYDKLHGEIEPVAEAVSDSEVTIEGNPLSFNTLSSQNAKSTILSCEPIQDLHGYSYPWVGGAGKNLLPLTVDGIKALNTSGSWSGNTYTVNGGTFTIITDSDGNVIGTKVEGTFTNTSFLILVDGNDMTTNFAKAILGKTIILNGCPKRTGNPYVQVFNTWGTTSQIYDNGNDLAQLDIPSTIAGYRCHIEVYAGTINNAIFYPMIRLSTETDATFQPYTNECGISGRTEIGILGCGKNLLPNVTEQGSINAEEGYEMSSTTRLRTPYIYLSAGTYTISNGEGFPEVIDSYDENKNYIPNATLTTWADSPRIFTAQSGYYRFLFRKPDGATIIPSELLTPQIEKKNQATSYTPYIKSNDITISFGQTVYGGTLDVENGVLVVDKKYKLYDGSSDEEWTYSSGWSKTNTSVFYSNVVVTDAYYPSEEFISITNCNCFEGVSRKSLYEADTNGVAFSGNRPTANFTVRISKSIASSLEDFETWIASNNIEIVYILNTPITINLTPHTINLLKGVNNISTTGDKITLTYRDGSVATLGDLTSAVDNLDSKIDESKILTDTATGDKYILVVTNGVLSVEQISN